MRLRSLLDLDLPPLVDAERLLAELRDQRTWRLAGAVVLFLGTTREMTGERLQG